MVRGVVPTRRATSPIRRLSPPTEEPGDFCPAAFFGGAAGALVDLLMSRRDQRTLSRCERGVAQEAGEHPQERYGRKHPQRNVHVRPAVSRAALEGLFGCGCAPGMSTISYSTQFDANVNLTIAVDGLSEIHAGGAKTYKCPTTAGVDSGQPVHCYRQV